MVRPSLVDLERDSGFISYEPALGSLDIDGLLDTLIRIESFAPARAEATLATWIQSGDYSPRDQCQRSGVAFFMKQIIKKAAIPNDLLVRKFPMPRRYGLN